MRAAWRRPEAGGVTGPAVGTALLAPLLGSGAHVHLPLVVLAWMLVLRLPRAQREGLGGSLALYALGLAGLVAAGIALALGAHGPGGTARELAVMVLGLAGIRLGGIVLFRVALPALRLRPPRMVEDLATFAGYVVWAMVRLSQVGVDLGSIVATSAVITAIVAFSLQETLGNIFGGATLQLENSIHVGDWIKFGDVNGRVVDIRWRSTVVETRNWETVVIPNSALMKERFTILGRRLGEPLQWRRWVHFNASFDVPPRRVIQAVEDALRRASIPGVAAVPPPNCVAMDLNDSTMQYALRYWLTDLAADDPTDSAVRERIYAAFRRAGLDFAFDEQIVHLVQSGEAAAERHRRRDLERRVAVLRRIELFAGFSDAEREALAGHLTHAPFLAGETLTRQGDVAHWLYLVVSGEVEVVFDAGGGQRHELGTIRGGAPGAFFGEMGLLTGAPRTASVVATTDVECYRLDKEGLEGVLKARPAIAEEISEVMAQRKADLAAAQQALGAAARARLLEDSRGELLARIRRFFSLEG
jgi:small-conductance mechanosensitive channel/CRP-like cAMP-binding protein